METVTTSPSTKKSKVVKKAKHFDAGELKKRAQLENPDRGGAVAASKKSKKLKKLKKQT